MTDNDRALAIVLRAAAATVNGHAADWLRTDRDGYFHGRGGMSRRTWKRRRPG